MVGRRCLAHASGAKAAQAGPSHHRPRCAARRYRLHHQSRPTSQVLFSDYATIVEEMLSQSIIEIGLIKYQQLVNMQPTQIIDTYEKLARRFWL